MRPGDNRERITVVHDTGCAGLHRHRMRKISLPATRVVSVFGIRHAYDTDPTQKRGVRSRADPYTVPLSGRDSDVLVSDPDRAK